MNDTSSPRDAWWDYSNSTSLNIDNGIEEKVSLRNMRRDRREELKRALGLENSAYADAGEFKHSSMSTQPTG